MPPASAIGGAHVGSTSGEPDVRVDLGSSDQLVPGHWSVFRYPDEKTPAILIRRESGEHLPTGARAVN